MIAHYSDKTIQSYYLKKASLCVGQPNYTEKIFPFFSTHLLKIRQNSWVFGILLPLNPRKKIFFMQILLGKWGYFLFTYVNKGVFF